MLIDTTACTDSTVHLANTKINSQWHRHAPISQLFEIFISMLRLRTLLGHTATCIRYDMYIVLFLTVKVDLWH